MAFGARVCGLGRARVVSGFRCVARSCQNAMDNCQISGEKTEGQPVEPLIPAPRCAELLALDDVHGQPTARRLLVFDLHVASGLHHRLHDLIQTDDLGAVPSHG